MDDQTTTNRKITIAIILGLSLWGIFHTAGIFLASDDPKRAIIKAGIVMAFMAGFLGFWVVMLRWRARQAEDDSDIQ